MMLRAVRDTRLPDTLRGRRAVVDLPVVFALSD